MSKTGKIWTWILVICGILTIGGGIITYNVNRTIDKGYGFYQNTDFVR